MVFYAPWFADTDSTAIVDSGEARASVDTAHPRDPVLAEWFGGGRSSAGVTVNDKAVQGVTAAYRCVLLLAESVAGLPLKLYRHDGNRRVMATDHPAYYLFEDGPDDDMDGRLFREIGGIHLGFRGNYFARITVLRNGEFQLSPLDPDRMRVEKSERYGRYYKYFHGKGEEEILLPGEVLHIQGPGGDGLVGYNPIQVHRQSLGLTIAQDEFGARFFANGTHIGKVFGKEEGPLSEVAYNRLRSELTQKFSGMENAHRAIILEEGLKPLQIGMSARDAQFLDSRKFQVAEVCRIFGVPNHMVNDLERATFSNIEQMAKQFVDYSLMSWLQRWESRLNKTLLTQRDRRQGYYWKHNVNALLRGDSAARADFYQKAILSGYMTRNEVREKEDMNPIDGLDKPLAPQNMAAVNDEGDLQPVNE